MSLPLMEAWAVNPNSEAGARLVIPSKYKLDSYSITVRDDSNTWTEDATNIGWCKWTKETIAPQQDGSILIEASLYNWSADRIRNCRIVAIVD